MKLDPMSLNVILSASCIIVVLLVRLLLVRAIEKWNLRSLDFKRRWLNQVRNVSVILIFFALVVIWVEELRTLALSIAAISVAIVIASKELLMCVAGSFVKSGAGAFRVGDLIEVEAFDDKPIVGDVVTQTLLATAIVLRTSETSGSQFEGKRVVIPNSYFLTSPVANLSIGQYHRMFHFTVSLPKTMMNLPELSKQLLKIVKEEAHESERVTLKLLRRISETMTIDELDGSSSVTMDYSDSFSNRMHIRVPVRRGKEAELKDRVLNRFFSDFPQA